MSITLAVSCEHISDFVLITDFEQANVCWVHIEKIDFCREDCYIMRYVVAF